MLNPKVQVLIFVILCKVLVASPQVVSHVRRPEPKQDVMLQSVSILYSTVMDKTEDLRRQYESWSTLQRFITSSDAIPYVQQFILIKQGEKTSNLQGSQNIVSDFVEFLRNFEYDDTEKLIHIIQNAKTFSAHEPVHNDNQNIQKVALQESEDTKCSSMSKGTEGVDVLDTTNNVEPQKPQKSTDAKQEVKVVTELPTLKDQSNDESPITQVTAEEKETLNLLKDFLKKLHKQTGSKVKSTETQNVASSKTVTNNNGNLHSNLERQVKPERTNTETADLLKQLLGQKTDDKKVTVSSGNTLNKKKNQETVNGYIEENKLEDILESLKPVLGLFVAEIDPITKKVTWKPKLRKSGKSNNKLHKERRQKEADFEENFSPESRKSSKIEIVIKVAGAGENVKSNPLVRVQKIDNNSVSPVNSDLTTVGNNMPSNVTRIEEKQNIREPKQGLHNAGQSKEYKFYKWPTIQVGNTKIKKIAQSEMLMQEVENTTLGYITTLKQDDASHKVMAHVPNKVRRQAHRW